MSDDDLNQPITQDDIDSLGTIECYSCEQPITIPPGGEWVLTRPNTAYALCAECRKPTADQLRETIEDLVRQFAFATKVNGKACL